MADAGGKAQVVREVCAASGAFSVCPHRRRSPRRPPFVDWYLVLAVPEAASEDAVRKRYRQLALQLHPDKNRHAKAEIAFKIVSEAHACLTDEGRRRAFDDERAASFCAACHDRFRSSLAPVKHRAERRTPATATNSSAHAKQHGGGRRTPAPAQALRDVEKRLRDECRVIDSCLRANDAGARRRQSFPLFDPSDRRRFPDYPHTRPPPPPPTPVTGFWQAEYCRFEKDHCAYQNQRWCRGGDCESPVYQIRTAPERATRTKQYFTIFRPQHHVQFEWLQAGSSCSSDHNSQTIPYLRGQALLLGGDRLLLHTYVAAAAAALASSEGLFRFFPSSAPFASGIWASPRRRASAPSGSGRRPRRRHSGHARAEICRRIDRAPELEQRHRRRGSVATVERPSGDEWEADEEGSAASVVLDPPILAPDMDSSVEKGGGSIDPDDRTASGEPKACTDCHTTKTPLWRGGPSGPKSLCNACGIRYRKKRREALGLDAGEGAERQEKKKSKREREREEVTVELRVVGFDKDVVFKQRRRMRRRRRLSEEEKAAILLMALSSGVIYA
ncbi:hypothetical protein GUJ93_ZPchr0013g35880 [Zizania palustris]|uniref:J domain-containing protein n=1 Tax=Zizania palustris TaxID=103762 RepID=A0A8J6BWV9_ZIZPA|nr:hypothetical protein GUJ93_ZPchr0013g35880 [Zizania palustris]